MRTIFLIIFTILLSKSLFAQVYDTMNPIFDVNPGTEEIYRIRLIDGKTYYAKILQLNSTEVILLQHGSDTVNIQINQIEKVAKKRQTWIRSVGIGLGIPYGTIGANLDIKLHEYFYLSGGIGISTHILQSYAIGSKIILRPEYRVWRPRFSIFYNAPIRGIGLGLGQQWTLGANKKWAIDLDVQYVVPIDIYNQQSRPHNSYLMLGGLKNIAFSYGFRYCF